MLTLVITAVTGRLPIASTLDIKVLKNEVYGVYTELIKSKHHAVHGYFSLNVSQTLNIDH